MRLRYFTFLIIPLEAVSCSSPEVAAPADGRGAAGGAGGEQGGSAGSEQGGSAGTGGDPWGGCEADSRGTGGPVKALASGYQHTCVLFESGRVKCWGSNDNGELGVCDERDRGNLSEEMGEGLPFVSLGSERSAVALAVGWNHTCALLDDGSVKCWGGNHSGQLGIGDDDTRGDSRGELGDALPAVALGKGRTARALSAGARHTCALLDDASIKCWGLNENGQLGLGDTETRGDASGEMGSALPAVALGKGRTAKAVSSGSQHSCAVLDDGSIKCWGWNHDGQLGLGDVENRGDNAAEMGDGLPAIPLGTGRSAKAVLAGEQSSCALLDDDAVKCWGRNVAGELGLGDTVNRGDLPDQMGDALPVVSLGSEHTAQALTGAAWHTCALLEDDAVKCWGFNSVAGSLGLGDRETRGDTPGEMGDDLPAVALGTGRSVKALSAGWAYTCAVLDDGSVKCWGSNYRGQLGLGDAVGRGDDPEDMGDNLPAVDL